MLRKTILMLVSVSAFCVGCVSDFGRYSVRFDADRYKYNPQTYELIPLFDVKKQAPEVQGFEGSNLIGKWRVRINQDYVQQFFGPDGNVALGYGCSCWEVDEYEFRSNGSYSMRRVKKGDEEVLANSGEDGQWTYDNGVLRLKVTRRLPQLPQNVDVESKEEYCVKWHSNSSFTLRNSFVDSKRLQSELPAGSKWYYGANGCLYRIVTSHTDKGGGFMSSVDSPMVFKRITK